jgi:hypothetical protein
VSHLHLYKHLPINDDSYHIIKLNILDYNSTFIVDGFVTDKIVYNENRESLFFVFFFCLKIVFINFCLSIN